MTAAAAALRFEEAARLRDEIHMLETLDRRGELDTHVQPEVFYIDPKKGLAGLKKCCKLAQPPRTIEGVDIAHLGGTKPWPAWCSSSTACRSSRATSSSRSAAWQGIDDFASIHEVVARRFQRLRGRRGVFPDILLIDGGKGQLNAALAAFAASTIAAADGHLAGQARGGDLRAGSRRAAATEPAFATPCGCCNTSATRPTASPSITTTSCGVDRRWGSELWGRGEGMVGVSRERREDAKGKERNRVAGGLARRWR